MLLDWNAELEKSNQALAESDLDDTALVSLRQRLIEIRDGARSAGDKIGSQASPLRDELNALGPPPAKDAQTEAANIAIKRTALNEDLAALEGQIKEAELLVSRAEEILEQISAIRIHRFTRKIFSRGFSPVAPEFWLKGIPNLLEKLASAKTRFEAWQFDETDDAFFKRVSLHLSLILIVVLAIVWPFSRWFSRKFGRMSDVEIPASFCSLSGPSRSETGW